LVAPFALALSLLAALLVFLFPTDDCLYDPGGAGCRSLFHADAHRRDCISVSCLPSFAVTGKSDNLMEVNNLQSKPKFYWPEMRLVLCLECSKKFEALRSGTIWSQKFERAILATNGSIPGPVKVPIGNDTITFTQTHLVQIQMILKKKLL